SLTACATAGASPMSANVTSGSSSPPAAGAAAPVRAGAAVSAAPLSAAPMFAAPLSAAEAGSGLLASVSTSSPAVAVRSSSLFSMRFYILRRPGAVERHDCRRSLPRGHRVRGLTGLLGDDPRDRAPQ